MKDAYAKAEHWSTKRQLLSIIAADMPTRLLKLEFPGLTDWKIKSARAQAFFNGIAEKLRNVIFRGHILLYLFRAWCSTRHYEESHTKVYREATRTLYCLHPITSYNNEYAFWRAKIKLSNGEHIVVPDVIRNVIPSRIVSQYLAYCNETKDDNFKPLGSSTLFAVLKKCGARMRKSLAGLDNFSCDGSTAFDQLRSLCDELATYGKY